MISMSQTIEGSGFSKTLIPASGLLILFATSLIGGSSVGFIIFIAALIFSAEFLFGLYSAGTISPYIFMMTSPITLLFYSSTTDFTIRLASLVLLSYIASAPFLNVRIREKISGAMKKPFIIWVIPLLLFTLISVWLDHKGVELSGDEPHYLMVAQSLVEDHDLSLQNNIEDRTYMDFIPVELPGHVIIHKGKHLSFHMPGLSFLLIPFYFIFKLTGNIISPHLFFRLSISAINSLFPFVLFLLMRNFFPDKKITGIWFLSLLTVPLLFHSVHIFPELPAATLLAASFLLLFRNKPGPGLAGFLFSLTIWFHVKYYPLLALFALVAIWKLMKRDKKKDILKFLVFPILSSIALLLFTKVVYGTFNPSGIFPAENYWVSPITLKLKVFCAYFIDQRDGLFFYAPVLFLFLSGLKIWEPSWRVLLSLLGTYTLFHAITTVRGAHSPAGRPLVFVLWIIMLFVFNYYFRSDRKHLFKLLTGLNLFVLYWILQYPQFIYQPVFASTTDGGSSLLKFLGSRTLDLTRLFPSFLTNPGTTQIPNIIWISVLLIILIIFYSGKLKKIHISKTTIRSGTTIFFILSIVLVSLFPHVHISAADRFHRGGISLFNTSSNFVWLENENSFRIKSNEEYTIYFEERKWKKNLVFTIEIPEKSSIFIKNKKDILFKTERSGEARFRMDLSKMETLSIRGQKLIPVWIKTSSMAERTFFSLRIESR